MSAPTLEVITGLLNAGQYDQAAVLCEQLCSRPPVDARAWQILGAIHGLKNNDRQAEACTRQALAIQPGMASASRNLAILLQRQGRYAEAEQELGRALKLHPEDASFHFELGNVCKQTSRLVLAIASYREAVRLLPGYRDAWFNLGNVLLETRELYGALECMRTAWSLDNGFIRAKAMEANILEMLGKIDDAWQCLEPWQHDESVPPVFADAFAAVSRHIGKEQQAAALMQKLLAAGRVPEAELSGFRYRLGGLQERLEQYDQAFESFRKAGEQAPVADNAARFIQGMHDARRLFTRQRLDTGPRLEGDGGRQVYIVGMPRSGTSLVEQILSAHSALTAGGELPYVGQLAAEVMPLLEMPDPDPELIRQHGRRYLDVLSANFGRKDRVTDKTPHNYRHLGLIHMLFPDAIIIHCRRSPLDTCLSCFSKDFVGRELAYTNRLESLGRVYAEYQSLLEYWKNGLSIPMLDVPYEAVVSDPEAWARRIVAYCGLAWEPQCLDFHKVKRQVFTASYNQVRQPVYRSSVRRWQRFERQLDPLSSVLGKTEDTYQQYLHRIAAEK